jgi:ATP-dependent exoDNAse (exonuclease V) alpha subunit
VAIYRLQINSISRGAGRSAIAAAAYRAGERLRDQRTGRLHNYAKRTDVSHAEIFLPSRLRPADVPWATDRERLWNAAEASERPRNARLAREYVVALPAELDSAQRLQLGRRLALELADRHNVAVDLAMHDPRTGSDPRNYHAHLLVTSREISASGFGAKAGLDMESDERQRRGLPVGIAEIKAIRERWAQLNNEAFASAGLEVRVDHRSLRAQGIDREPQPKIPFAAMQMERRGLRSDVADRIRQRWRERVRAREGRSAAPDLETVRRQGREAWLALREQAAAAPQAVAPAAGLKQPHTAHIEGSSHARLGSPQPSAAPKAPADQRRTGVELALDGSDRDFAL